MNRLQSQDPGGVTRFAGSLSEAAAVTVQGKSATVAADNSFTGTATLASGSNTVQVQAIDYSGNLRTNTYTVNVTATSNSFTHDANGNITSESDRTFEWDAENRLSAINNGSHRVEFTYDGASRRTRIVEKENGSVITDVRLLWCDNAICEERDSTGITITQRFFEQGEQRSGDIVLYARDHLGSIRQFLNDVGTVRASYEYDPYGRQIRVTGDSDARLSFSGDFYESSGLLLTRYRAYDPNLGRWLSEDPVRFGAGIDFYSYVGNNPIGYVDPLGLWRLPDYLSVNVNITIPTPWTGTLFGWSGIITLDRYGNWYWSLLGGGAGKSLTGVSGSLTVNWMNQRCKPTEPQLHDMLTSHGFNVSGGFWGGLSESYTPGTGTATGIGFVSPQIGGSYNYSFKGPGKATAGW